jgi:hypothetical protein
MSLRKFLRDADEIPFHPLLEQINATRRLDIEVDGEV